MQMCLLRPRFPFMCITKNWEKHGYVRGQNSCTLNHIIWKWPTYWHFRIMSSPRYSYVYISPHTCKHCIPFHERFVYCTCNTHCKECTHPLAQAWSTCTVYLLKASFSSSQARSWSSDGWWVDTGWTRDDRVGDFISEAKRDPSPPAEMCVHVKTKQWKSCTCMCVHA